MKIYVNEQYEILSLDEEPAYYNKSFETERTREDMFGDFCNPVIQGFKYEPCYELLFNEDGSNARNEKTGELLYKLDDEGNKIPSGYSCYPYIDYQTLILIQKQYEESQRHVHALNAQVAYLSMMSGYEMEV
ncbi:hypothetical protein [Lacrimispora sp.]|uniref:hypothetical protein n=1 Tax=Lacrimispora sp. TaxID=2719234 RepID=UPI00285F358A|nr:hypothetical protein [Lacrimispora sp.]MDR7812088.1 hypothetical protein [Lacrimispora sp.]